MDANDAGQPAAEGAAEKGDLGGQGDQGGQASQLRVLSRIALFDAGGPLALYALLRSAGLSSVTSLLISGVFPALGVGIGAVRHRRIDAIGALVLSGILVGTVAGVVSHDAKLVLLEGSVPTAVFGAVCLGSIATRRPLMFGLALEFAGPDTPMGREMIGFWQYPQFRHLFRVITAVWGAGFLAEAAVRVVIVENVSAGAALAISKAMPFVVAGLLSAWTLAYSRHHKRKGERAAAAEAGETADQGTAEAR